MRIERRKGKDPRRAPRFGTRLWVGIPEVEGEPELESCVMSAYGMLLRTPRDAGSPGAVRMLRLVTEDLGAGINIMSHVVRVVMADDGQGGQVIEATAFEFLPHNPQELEEFMRVVVAGEIEVLPDNSPDHQYEVQVDRRRGDRASDSVRELCVSGIVIDANCALEQGAVVSIEIEAPFSNRELRLTGQTVKSSRIEDTGEGERYLIEVSFGTGEDRWVSKVADVVDTLVSSAETTSQPDTDREGVHLSGSLSEVALPSLLAFLELERSTGVLELERDGTKAKVFVQDGRLFDIELDPPGPSPTDALADLLEWSEGAFEFGFKPVERDDVIGQSTTALLMECARISDERSR